MSTYRIADAARLLGVSDDTARRWAESGKFATTNDEAGRLAVDGAELARFATTLPDAGPNRASSRRPTTKRAVSR